MNQSSKIRIIIADDHAVLRQGIRYLCLAASDVTLVGEAASGEEALALCHELQPDIALVDLMMPGMDGIATTRAIREQCPEVKILVLTSFNTENLIRQAIEAGAKGYILKNASMEDILNAIRVTYKGIAIMSPEVTDIINRHLQKLEMSSRYTRVSDPFLEMSNTMPSNTILTPRQLEVLKLMVQGLNNTQIGHALYISPYTARFHVCKILGKLGVSNRTEAVSVALQQKLV